MKKTFIIIALGLVVLIAFVLINFSHVRSASVSEMADVVNSFFAAIDNDDQRLLDKIVITPHEVAAKSAGAPKSQSTVYIDVKIESARQTEPAIVFLNDLRAERKAYAGLGRPISFSYKLDPMAPRLVLNYDCQSAVANTCIKHIYFFFTGEGSLRIHSIQDFRNTEEWDRIWNNQFSKGLITENAPPNLLSCRPRKNREAIRAEWAGPDSKDR